MLPIFSFATMATTRLVTYAFMLSLWLISRPGGWAVLAVLVLFGVKLMRWTPA